MAIDLDILSFSEYNSNVSDINTKLSFFYDTLKNAAAADNTKMMVKRGSKWALEGEEVYNNRVVDLGNLTGGIPVTLTNQMAYCAILGTVTGDVQISAFSGILTGVPYQMFLKQDATGGHTFRFPNGTSTMFSIDLTPNSVTPVVFVKLPNGSLFAKFKSFASPVGIGLVSAMIGRPTITNPVGAALLSFTWTKSAAIGYGGTLTDLYSDWEIASDNLYSSLLFSSYLDTVHLSSIDVILAGGGTVYMRTRYGGKLDGVDMASEWAAATLKLGTFSGDEFWDQTVLCINANKYAWDGSRKIVDEKGNSLTINGNTAITAVGSKFGIKGTGSVSGYISTPFFPAIHKPTDKNITIEMFVHIGSSFSGCALTDAPNDYPLFVGDMNSPANYWSFGFTNSGKMKFYYWKNTSSGEETCITDNVVGVLNSINHLALVISYAGGINTAKMFCNGVLVKTFTMTGVLHSATTGILNIFGFYSTGYISTEHKMMSLRITANVCRYTSDFSVDLTKPYFETGNLWWTPKPNVIDQIYDPEYFNWDKTVSCVNFYGVNNSTSFIDELSGNTLTASGDAKIAVTSNLSYANFDGTGDSIAHSLVPGWYFGATDWCIELFVEPTSTGTVLSDAISNGGYYAIRLIYDSANGRFTCLLYDASVNLIAINTANSSVVAGTKYHVAVVRYGTSIYLFLNGALAGTGTIGSGVATYQSGSNLKLGVYGTGDYFTGKVYAVRVSHFARYLAAFTVDSTMPYFTQKPVVSNWKDTVLAISAQGMKVGSTDIRDYKNSIISIIGDTKCAIDSNNLPHINFDGIGDGLLSSGMVSIMPSTGWCFSFVAKINGYSTSTTYSTIFADNVYGTANFSFYINFSGVITPFLRSASYAATIASDTANVAHYCFDFDGTTLRSFKNGVLQGSCAFTGDTNIVPTFGIMFANNLGTNVKLYSMEIVKKSKHVSNFKVDLSNPYFPVQETFVDVWVDPSERKNMTLATGVSDIKERSGNDYHFTQSTAANQPALLPNFANGLQVFDFDGVDDFLSLELSFSKSKNIFLLMILDYDVAGTSKAIISAMNSVGQNSSDWFTAYTPGTVSSKFGYNTGDGTSYSYGYGSTEIVVDTDYLLGYTYKNGDNFCDIYVQTQKDSLTKPATACSSSNTGSTLPVVVGRIGSFDGYYFNGQMLDIVMSSFPPTDYFRFMVEGFITKKYAKTNLLPSGHKFKNFFPTGDQLTDPYASNVVLCLNANEQYRQDMYFDSSARNKITKSGSVNVACGADNKPYFKFDATINCALVFPSNNVLFGARDFTIELFIEINGYYATGSRLLNADGDIYHEISIGVELNGMISVYSSSNGTSWNMVTAPSVFQTSLNTLYHFAVVRHGGNLYFFANGVKSVISSTLGTTVLAPSNPKRSIGGQSNGVNRSLNGKIYSYRITDGVARYTSDFTPDMSNPYFAYSVPNFYNPEKYLLKAWYDSYDTAFVKRTGALVEKLVDKSGNGIDLVPDAPSDRPTLSTNAITFTTNMLGKSGLNIDINSYCIIGVFSSSTTGSTYAGFVNVSSYNKEDPELCLGVDTYDRVYADSGYKINVDGLSTARHLKAVDFGTSATILYNEGNVVVTASTSSLSVLDYIKIGYYSAANGTFSGYRNGVLHELLICHTSIRQKIEGYLAHKWDYLLGSTALKDALPVNHPYKSTGPV